MGSEGQEAAAVLLVRSSDYDEGVEAVVAGLNPFDQQGVKQLLGSYYYYRLRTNPTGRQDNLQLAGSCRNAKQWCMFAPAGCLCSVDCT